MIDRHPRAPYILGMLFALAGALLATFVSTPGSTGANMLIGSSTGLMIVCVYAYFAHGRRHR